jgi:hypothetical protein
MPDCPVEAALNQQNTAKTATSCKFVLMSSIDDHNSGLLNWRQATLKPIVLVFPPPCADVSLILRYSSLLYDLDPG